MNWLLVPFKCPPCRSWDWAVIISIRSTVMTQFDLPRQQVMFVPNEDDNIDTLIMAPLLYNSICFQTSDTTPSPFPKINIYMTQALKQYTIFQRELCLCGGLFIVMLNFFCLFICFFKIINNILERQETQRSHIHTCQKTS